MNIKSIVDIKFDFDQARSSQVQQVELSVEKLNPILLAIKYQNLDALKLILTRFKNVFREAIKGALTQNDEVQYHKKGENTYYFDNIGYALIADT